MRVESYHTDLFEAPISASTAFTNFLPGLLRF